MADLYEIALIVIILAIAAFSVWYVVTIIRKKPVTGAESLIGAKGFVYSETLSREGEVSIDEVIWRARLANPAVGELKKGDEIIVNRVDDITLIVDRSTASKEIS